MVIQVQYFGSPILEDLTNGETTPCSIKQFDQGESFVLNCGTSSADGESKIIWYKFDPQTTSSESREESRACDYFPRQKRNIIGQDGHLVKIDDQNLLITNAIQSDEGSYMCMEIRSRTKDQPLQYFYLLPKEDNFDPPSHVPPEFLQRYSSPPRVVGMLHQTFRLMCNFRGNPDPEILWDYPENMDNQRLTKSRDSREIVLRDIEFSDAGKYTCTGRNERAESASYDIQVEIHSPPIFSEVAVSRNLNATRGQNVTYFCFSEVLPIPEVKWYFNEQRITSQDHRWKIENNGTHVRNPDVQFIDTGTLRCNVTNQYGFFSHNAYLVVMDTSRQNVKEEVIVVQAGQKGVIKTATNPPNSIKDKGTNSLGLKIGLPAALIFIMVVVLAAVLYVRRQNHVVVARIDDVDHDVENVNAELQDLKEEVNKSKLIPHWRNKYFRSKSTLPRHFDPYADDDNIIRQTNQKVAKPEVSVVDETRHDVHNTSETPLITPSGAAIQGTKDTGLDNENTKGQETHGLLGGDSHRDSGPVG